MFTGKRPVPFRLPLFILQGLQRGHSDCQRPGADLFQLQRSVRPPHRSEGPGRVATPCKLSEPLVDVEGSEHNEAALNALIQIPLEIQPAHCKTASEKRAQTQPRKRKQDPDTSKVLRAAIRPIIKAVSAKRTSKILFSAQPAKITDK